jgi:hypothetical protein
VTAYIESSSGVAIGGRTGLMAVVTGILFRPPIATPDELSMYAVTEEVPISEPVTELMLSTYPPMRRPVR